MTADEAAEHGAAEYEGAEHAAEETCRAVGPVVCAALGLEARAVRRGLTGMPVVVVGYRARRADRLPGDRAALVVVGFGGALDERLRPGDVLVADEIRAADPGVRPVPCGAPRLLAEELIRDGLSVQVGPLVTTGRVVRGRERAIWAAQGARVADMESAVVAAQAGGRPVAAVRVVVDGPGRPLLRPGTIGRGLVARRVLARVGPALERWGALLVRGEADPTEGAEARTP
ncbi:1-hydroxy-2-methyl-2-butenyl 4-diphosphate reductase [Actinomadura decatromicini]|uniref:1-hydroxy-2-methyl-2-butenyl 4-diphosphate reductase n=1 Tax=Actinomadura decatromicini TaxID=2604572 RepID=A0A5D3FJC8_9ACTN|nr:1-hydroxy-2-methyl-2-butenyl 4-diphosphate reductase [Actinomadura decatromicini]TYK47810.1 1-hydroxy-2-methyl-2-butenyl 4-diphosphate reductase [Actinomadura decatromicini]